MNTEISQTNGLSPAEIERLAIIAEECGEISQAVGKVLRFGWDSAKKSDPTVTGRTMLNQEVSDLLVALEMLLVNGDLTRDGIEEGKKFKINKLKNYLRHNTVDNLFK